jgi:2-methylisocitrate lyase-like PEP mutase family enzyme
MMLSATAAIHDATGLSLCVDVGDGFGNAFNVGRTAANMRTAGADALQLGDNLQPGHEPHETRLIADMIGKVKAMIDAAPEFLLVARTMRLPGESLAPLIDRSSAYAEAGASIILVSGSLTTQDLTNLATHAHARTPFALECDEAPEKWRTPGVIMICQPMRLQNQLVTAAKILLPQSSAAGSSSGARQSQVPAN